MTKVQQSSCWMISTPSFARMPYLTFATCTGLVRTGISLENAVI
jgi:hypothetical protein